MSPHARSPAPQSPPAPRPPSTHPAASPTTAPSNPSPLCDSVELLCDSVEPLCNPVVLVRWARRRPHGFHPLLAPRPPSWLHLARTRSRRSPRLLPPLRPTPRRHPTIQRQLPQEKSRHRQPQVHHPTHPRQLH